MVHLQVVSTARVDYLPQQSSPALSPRTDNSGDLYKQLELTVDRVSASNG